MREAASRSECRFLSPPVQGQFILRQNGNHAHIAQTKVGVLSLPLAKVLILVEFPVSLNICYAAGGGKLELWRAIPPIMASYQATRGIMQASSSPRRALRGLRRLDLTVAAMIESSAVTRVATYGQRSRWSGQRAIDPIGWTPVWGAIRHDPGDLHTLTEPGDNRFSSSAKERGLRRHTRRSSSWASRRMARPSRRRARRRPTGEARRWLQGAFPADSHLTFVPPSGSSANGVGACHNAGASHTDVRLHRS